MSRIYYTANPRNDFNDWQDEHSGSGLRCCICGKEIKDKEALCWQNEYCHIDEDCSYDFWNDRIKEYLKELVK